MSKLKLLVVRNDKIGDFMLAWPAFALLKQSLDCHITALVPGYTAPLAQLCPSIDAILHDPGKKADKSAKQQLITQIKQHNFDAVICFFSDTYNATIMWKAGIKQRWAPATKLAQIFYNHRITQRRSHSLKPEYVYNMELAEAFIRANGGQPQPVSAPWLSFPPAEIELFKQQQAQLLQLDASRPWIMLHAGCGGSANNLNASQYGELIDLLGKSYPQAQILVTAGPGEEELAQQVIQIGGNTARLAAGLPLKDFAMLLACANLFISGSTGPLHLAAAIDTPTMGFFPRIRSSTALRWQPINSEGRHLAFSPPEGADANDMATIVVKECLIEGREWLDGFITQS